MVRSVQSASLLAFPSSKAVWPAKGKKLVQMQLFSASWYSLNWCLFGATSQPTHKIFIDPHLHHCHSLPHTSDKSEGICQSDARQQCRVSAPLARQCPRLGRLVTIILRLLQCCKGSSSLFAKKRFFSVKAVIKIPRMQPQASLLVCSSIVFCRQLGNEGFKK